MKKQDKHNPTTPQLPEDASFIRWILAPFQDMDEYWDCILNNSPEKEMRLSQLKNLLENIRIVEKKLSENDKQTIWNNINNNIHHTQTHSITKRKFRIAAAAVIGVVIIMAGYFLSNSYFTKPDIDYLSFVSQSDSSQYSQQIRLVTTNNKELIINEDNVELIYEKNGEVTMNSQQIKLDDEKENTQLNQLIVPYGKSSCVMLNDGTKIWVNSGSKLVYPSVFGKNKREVYVEGEIYLEVTKDEKSPFIVKTKMLEIAVLGTSFNVQAYKDETTQSVVLATGSVRIKNEALNETTEIVPNEMYAYNKKEKKSQIETVEIYDFICWKYGFIRFQSEKLSTVLHRLQRHYNIPINYNQEKLEQIRVSGKLDMKEHVSETFKSIALTAPISYKIDKDYINVSVKPQ